MRLFIRRKPAAVAVGCRYVMAQRVMRGRRIKLTNRRPMPLSRCYRAL